MKEGSRFQVADRHRQRGCSPAWLLTQCSPSRRWLSLLTEYSPLKESQEHVLYILPRLCFIPNSGNPSLGLCLFQSSGDPEWMLGVGRLLMKIYYIIKIISSQVLAFSSLVLAILIFLSFNIEFVFYSSDYLPFFQDFISFPTILYTCGDKTEWKEDYHY